MSSGGRVWFTSDPHFGHRFVAGLRGFTGPDEHDAALMANFTSVVREGDQVWWLGDLAMSNPKRALTLISGLRGTHHLIAGNHDRCHPSHRDSHKHLRAYLDVFASVQPFARRRINGEEVLLSHFPYANEPDADRGEVRDTQYRLANEGRWLLHGHTHMADQRVHGRQIHVGLDAWDLRPVPLTVIERLIPGYAP